MFNHILLPLDGSQLAEAAIPVTMEFCKKLDSTITLMHIIEKKPPSEIHGQRHLRTEMEATEYLVNIGKKFFNFCKKVECHVHTEEVSAVAASIVDHSGELKPDLIVLSAHGEGGIRDIVVGSIAQQVIAAGKVPVLLIRPELVDLHRSFAFKNILVPFDGEKEHDRSLNVAEDLAKKLPTSIHLIRVVPTISTLTGEQAALRTMLPATTSVYLDLAEEEAANYLQKKLENIRKQGIKCTAEVQRGDPAQEVVKSAINSKTSLIVLGTHGKAGLGAFWAGSVAPKIVAKTKLPVLLIPVRRFNV